MVSDDLVARYGLTAEMPASLARARALEAARAQLAEHPLKYPVDDELLSIADRVLEVCTCVLDVIEWHGDLGRG